MRAVRSAYDAGGVLLRRLGPRPRVSDALPFRQLEQWPSPEWRHRLLDCCHQMPYVRSRESRMAPPDTRALWIPDSVAMGPAEAFIDQHEFCHIHGLPEAGVHMTLAPESRERAVAFGWAMPHPLAATSMFRTLVLVYAPRNELELEVVTNLVWHSFRFAIGSLTIRPVLTSDVT